jgi:hypothetical protein
VAAWDKVKGADNMRDLILNTSLLPEPLFKMIRAPQIQVRETDNGIILIPVGDNQPMDAIRNARGMYADGKLTVDKFLAEKRLEEAGR